MNTEYEIRVIEIDKEDIIKKLDEIGAKKIGEYNQKRYVYDTKPKKDSQWIRLRTNGDKTTLTYKNIIDNTIDGTKELEIEVSDFNETNKLLEIMGYVNKGYQENNRIRFELNNVEIDIDTWPMIPTYLEIEGKNEEEIMNVIHLLQLDNKKITALNCKDIYKEIYGIDIDNIKDLRFAEI